MKDCGEFGFIRRVRSRLARGKVNALPLVGLGDDAFAARLSPQHLLVSTVDMLIEKVHFRRDWATPWEIGYKSMAVNLSDLAAMGQCRPLYGLVGLGMPGNTPVDFVDKLYTGMQALALKYGLLIVGGDTVSTKEDIAISVTLIGESKREHLLTRGGAQVGDRLLVTGTFGDSGAGLHLLAKNSPRTSKRDRFLIKKHLLPEPRLPEAAAIARSRKATAMLDASDGLAASVRLIGEESRVGAKVDLDRIPLSPALRELAAADPSVDAVQMALTGGEDYELVFTAHPRNVPALQRLVPGLSVVGEIVPGRKITYYRNGKPQQTDTTGFQHFK